MPSAQPPGAAPTPPPLPTGPVQRLTLAQTEQLALKNNPRMSVARLLALAQGQVTREVRAAELPFITGDMTGVEPRDEGNRIAAGALNSPRVFERAAGGLTLAQLITDFGRTTNLVASARFSEKASQANQVATSQDIILAVDEAFYGALEAQALLNVAQQTVNARQTTADQVNALAKAKLKSDLDVSFAEVNLAQAKLLLLDAENGQAEAFAGLNTILGFEAQQTYELVEAAAPLAPPPSGPEALVTLAFNLRPDLQAVVFNESSSERFRRAEHDLLRPTLSAVGVTGGVPFRYDNQFTPWYGGIGVNMAIPIFNGFLFPARAKEADYKTLAAQQQVRDLRDRIARDVRVTWLHTTTAYQRIFVAEQLLKEANLAMDLAQTRYNLGLGNIVELSQAQLQQTTAEIGNTNARYSYQIALAALKFQTGQ